MFRVLLSIGLVVVCLIAAPVSLAAVSNPFVGAWTSTDVDGSTQYATISGGSESEIRYIDLDGGICAANGAPTSVFTSTLTGEVSASTMDATFTSARCGPYEFDSLVGVSVTLTYDATNDTFSDGSVTWHRL